MREQWSEPREDVTGRKLHTEAELSPRYEGRKGGEGSVCIDERSAVRKRQIWYTFTYLFSGYLGTAVVSHSA